MRSLMLPASSRSYLLIAKLDVDCFQVHSFFCILHHHQELKVRAAILSQDVVAVCWHCVVKLNFIKGCDLVVGN